MTNAEFYAEEIKKFKGTNFCNEFIRPIVRNGGCDGTDCHYCNIYVALWLMEDCKEPEEPKINWKNVPVDTPILGRNNEREEWTRGHFAKFKDGDGKIGVWTYGGTSFTWSSDERNVYYWNQAKLWEGSEEQVEERKQNNE